MRTKRKRIQSTDGVVELRAVALLVTCSCVTAPSATHKKRSTAPLAAGMSGRHQSFLWTAGADDADDAGDFRWQADFCKMALCTRHKQPANNERQGFGQRHLPPLTCHLSPVISHLPLTTSHLSPVISHLPPVISHLQAAAAVVVVVVVPCLTSWLSFVEFNCVWGHVSTRLGDHVSTRL